MRTKELFQSWFVSKYFRRHFVRSVTQKVKFILKQPVRNSLEKTTRKEILEKTKAIQSIQDTNKNLEGSFLCQKNHENRDHEYCLYPCLVQPA